MRTIPEKRILEEALAKTVEKRTLHEHTGQKHKGQDNKDQDHKDDDKLVLEMAENFMALIHKYGRKGVETLLSGRLR